jgi:hypothetical protein
MDDGINILPNLGRNMPSRGGRPPQFTPGPAHAKKRPDNTPTLEELIIEEQEQMNKAKSTSSSRNWLVIVLITIIVILLGVIAVMVLQKQPEMVPYLPPMHFPRFPIPPSNVHPGGAVPCPSRPPASEGNAKEAQEFLQSFTAKKENVNGREPEEDQTQDQPQQHRDTDTQKREKHVHFEDDNENENENDITEIDTEKSMGQALFSQYGMS